MIYPEDINPQQANRDLQIVREAMGRDARVRSGDGLYFFVWGWAACLVMLTQRFLPGDFGNVCSFALYAAAIVASGMVGQRQRRSREGESRDFAFWLVIIGESFIFSALFVVLNGRGFQPDFLDVVNMMLFALGIVTVGAFSDMRVAAVGFGLIIAAVILPALLPLTADRIIVVALLTALGYSLAGWFIYRKGKMKDKD